MAILLTGSKGGFHGTPLPPCISHCGYTAPPMEIRDLETLGLLVASSLLRPRAFGFLYKSSISMDSLYNLYHRRRKGWLEGWSAPPPPIIFWRGESPPNSLDLILVDIQLYAPPCHPPIFMPLIRLCIYYTIQAVKGLANIFRDSF